MLYLIISYDPSMLDLMDYYIMCSYGCFDKGTIDSCMDFVVVEIDDVDSDEVIHIFFAYSS
jgi:hypothetical protein